MKFTIRDLLWGTVVVALLAVVVGLVVGWGMDHWTSEYMHGMYMRMKDGEINELKELLKKQSPAPNPPKNKTGPHHDQ